MCHGRKILLPVGAGTCPRYKINFLLGSLGGINFRVAIGTVFCGRDWNVLRAAYLLNDQRGISRNQEAELSCPGFSVLAG